MKYYPIEFQTNGSTGSVVILPMVNQEDKNEALALFHHAMEAAETSTVEKHGCVLFDENLNIVDGKAELGLRATPSENLPVFFVLEFQTGDGLGAVIPMAYPDKADAWNKYYTVLAYAAKSAVEKHGAVLITSDLFMVASRLAERNQVEPEPEPEPTPEN